MKRGGLLLIVTLGALLAVFKNEWLPFLRLRLKPVAVQLTDAGNDPRRVLRFAHHGAPQPFESVMQQTLITFTGILQGVTSYVPPIAIHWEPQSRTQRFGVSRTLWRIAVVAALPTADEPEDEAADAEARTQALAHAQALVDSVFTVYVGPRGQLHIDVPAFADAQVASFAERQRRALAQTITVPLPEEPVGRGARWHAVQHDRVAIAPDVELAEEVTLTDLTERGFDVDLAGRFSAAQTRVSASAVIDQVEGDYAGRVVALLGEATPVQSELSFRVGMAALEGAADDTQRGAKIILRGRSLVQASAIGPLQW